MGLVMINRELLGRRQIVGKVRKVSYGSEQIKIVEGGIDAIGMALYNGSEEEKASILFCLDRFLDPYYGYHCPMNLIFLCCYKIFSLRKTVMLLKKI